MSKKKNKTRFFNKNFVISAALIAGVAVVLGAAYKTLSNQTASQAIAQKLREEVSIRGINLENDIQTDIALSHKMASSPLVATFFANPEDETLKTLAFAELSSYQSSFSSNNIFWINDADKLYYYNGEYSYTLDPANPDSGWYPLTLHGSQILSFNMNYDIGIKKMQLWINTIVQKDKVPVGIAGTGITLDSFIAKCFDGLDPRISCYLFNQKKEITGAIDTTLLDQKKHIDSLYGKEINLDLLMQKAKELSGADGTDVFLFEPTASECGVIRYLPSYDWYLIASAPTIVGKKEGISVILIITIVVGAIFAVFVIIIASMQNMMSRIRVSQENERAIQQKEHEMGAKLFEEAQNLVVSTKETAATSQDSSAAVKEIVATMEDSNVLSENISTKIRDVSSVANQTSSDVADGVAQIEQNVAQLHEIFNANQQTIDGIKNLSEKIESIWDIVTLINNVADQAKIIAFNAELEASSAGEAGKSFRIVANEIRRLSDGIIDGTKEIKEKINEIQHSSDSLILASESGTEKINAGYENARGLGEKFESIKNSAEITATSAENIAEIIRQQASASEQILIALKEISAGVENFTVATDNISLTAENVRKISEDLNNASRDD